MQGKTAWGLGGRRQHLVIEAELHSGSFTATSQDTAATHALSCLALGLWQQPITVPSLDLPRQAVGFPPGKEGHSIPSKERSFAQNWRCEGAHTSSSALTLTLGERSSCGS